MDKVLYVLIVVAVTTILGVFIIDVTDKQHAGFLLCQRAFIAWFTVYHSKKYISLNKENIGQFAVGINILIKTCTLLTELPFTLCFVKLVNVLVLSTHQF